MIAGNGTESLVGISFLHKDFPNDTFYLIGSRAVGRANESSDWDFMVRCDYEVGEQRKNGEANNKQFSMVQDLCQLYGYYEKSEYVRVSGRKIFTLENASHNVHIIVVDNIVYEAIMYTQKLLLDKYGIVSLNKISKGEYKQLFTTLVDLYLAEMERLGY